MSGPLTPTKVGDEVVVCALYGRIIGTAKVDRITGSGQIIVGPNRYTKQGHMIGGDGSVRLRTADDEPVLAHLANVKRALKADEQVGHMIDRDRVGRLSGADTAALADHLEAAAAILSRAP
jgi:hypothetical protein